MFYVGKKYLMDGNQEVFCREYIEAESAHFANEDQDLGFDVEFDGEVWRHLDSGDILVVKEVR
jgi:hypothetical protein